MRKLTASDCDLVRRLGRHGRNVLQKGHFYEAVHLMKEVLESAVLFDVRGYILLDLPI